MSTEFPVILRTFKAIFFAAVLIAFCNSCDKVEIPSKENAAKNDSAENWVNWNIVFPPNTTADQRNKQLDEIKANLIAIVADTAESRGIGFSLTYKVDTCICDTLLYHLRGDLQLWGTTGSNTTPPPKTDPGASGDLLGSLIADNDEISLPEDSLEYSIDTSMILNISGAVDDRVKMAILDTGIDTALFRQQAISRLLWRNPTTTLNNFLIGGQPTNFADDNRGRHGSAVAALALRQFKGALPRLMVLKVLDRKGKGSIFTVSCALSYAAQNKANLINASLGYYGSKDSVLLHYIKRSQDSAALVVVAAGNRPGLHMKPKLCDPRLLGDDPLSFPNNLFFPACFNGENENMKLITVTGIASDNQPCFYQNFSNEFVDVGLISKYQCCAYQVPFTGGIEGSSFATPIVTGQIGRLMFMIGTNHTKSEFLSGIGAQNLSPAIIRGGLTLRE